MKITKNSKIYSTINSFRTNKKVHKSLSNDILKITKSLLINKSRYNKNWIQNNSNLNKSYLEKSGENIPLTYRPIINDKYNLNIKNISNYQEDSNYSLLDDNSFFLLNYNKSINKIHKKNFYLLKNKKEENNNYPKNINNNYSNNQKNIFLKLKKKILNYQKENINPIKIQNQNKSYNNYENNVDSLFIDFFYKWFNNNTSYKSIKSIINKNYSNLVYDEKEIFHYDYTEYINHKINEFKTDKIRNLQDKMQSNFKDINKKDIKLRLNGIQLTFIPQNRNNKKIIFNLPLTYSLLFYYKGINYFSKIILSIINFKNKNFDQISINYDENYICINKKKKIDNKIKTINNDINSLFKRITSKRITGKKKKSNSVIRINEEVFLKKEIINRINKDNEYIPIFYKNNKDRENHNTNVKFSELIKDKKNNKKSNISIHSNSNKNYNENHFYNIFYFIWETPKISYKVILEMPKIIFKYQDMSKNIITFCHRNLILFLLKKNFVNWDFYLMYYLFSIKSFREQILNFYAFSSRIYKSNLFIQKEKENINGNKIIEKEKIVRFNNSNIIKDSLSDVIKGNNIFLEDNNINISKKLSKKTETYHFFYTNISNINSLITFQSYQINTDFEKLNPNYSWEFFLNFKQMKFLNEIKKYEPLETFLPKIIKTNFENGSLCLDFTVFEDFEPKIINYDKKEIIIPYKIENKIINVWKSFRRKKNDMILKIKKPSLKIEKYYQESNNKNDEYTKELNEEFLNKIDKQKMNNWPRLIVDFIEENKLIDNNNYKRNDSPLIQKDNIKKRLKRRSITVKFDKFKPVIILKKYLNNLQK